MKKIKYLTISDIHLGHNINKTPYILDNLRSFFIEYIKELRDLDILFISGDIFDKLLINGSDEMVSIVDWFTELAIFCKRYSVKLRVLEGTPSHDWKQFKTINKSIEKLAPDVDLKYIETLYIEKMSDLNLSILYVPDEYKHKAKDTYEDIKKLLKENNLEKVDICQIHGQFHFQLPMITLESSHTEKDFLDIVKYFISVAHIHTARIYDRIIGQGSFDRLAHGEEEDKGAMLFTIEKDKATFKFLKNKKAMVFNTYLFKEEDLEDIVRELRVKLKKIPPFSNIRIISEREDFITKSDKELKKLFPQYTIKVEKPKVKKVSNKILDERIVSISIQITPDNIEELLLTELDKYNLNKKQLDIFKEELEKANHISLR